MITNTSKILPETPIVIVTLAKAKQQLRLGAAEHPEDDLIKDYINAAITASEQYINGDLIDKTLVITLDGFQSQFVFETYPVHEVASVKYHAGNVQVTMSTDKYYLISTGKRSVLVFKEQPITDERFDAVTISAKVGYQDAQLVPMPIKQAILLQVSDMYERREDRSETITTAAQALMRPYRNYSNG